MPTTTVEVINYEDAPNLPNGQTPAPAWLGLVRNPDTNEVWECELSRMQTAITPPTVSTNALPNVALALDRNSLTIGQTVTLTATATDSDGTIAKVEFFDVTTPIGTVLGSGPYALAYTPSTIGSHSLTAKATDNTGGTRTTAPTNLPVTAAPNAVPTVLLSLSTATVQQGSAVTLIATVGDADGTVTLVEYFDGATRIGQTTGIPHSISYAPGLAGSHSLYAKATDNVGGASMSAPQALSVLPNAANHAPTVSLSVIANNPIMGQAVLLDATAADSDGTVVLVEFYNSGTKIGQATQSPFSLSYTPTTAGSYFFSAKATDNQQATTQTTASFLLVSAAPVVAVVPDAPTSVVATAGNNTVSVDWTVPASNGGAAITSYAVFRNEGGAPINGNASKPYIDSTAVNGTAYTYRVLAHNSAGDGPKSLPSNSATPTAPVVTPPTFNTVLLPGDNVSSVTYNGATGTEFRFNAPLSASTVPNPATMLLFYPAGTQIGQVDYNGADTGTQCAALVGGVQRLTTFTNGSVTLS